MTVSQSEILDWAVSSRRSDKPTGQSTRQALGKRLFLGNKPEKS